MQLLIYGFHELTEANIFPYSEPLHWATEPYGPDGRYGQYLTYLLVMLPLGWLASSSLRAAARSVRAAEARRPASQEPKQARYTPGVAKAPTVIDLTWVGGLTFPAPATGLDNARQRRRRRAVAGAGARLRAGRLHDD